MLQAKSILNFFIVKTRKCIILPADKVLMMARHREQFIRKFCSQFYHQTLIVEQCTLQI